MMLARTRSPVVAGHDGFVDFQGVHQRDDVERERRRFAIPNSLG